MVFTLTRAMTVTADAHSPDAPKPTVVKVVKLVEVFPRLGELRHHHRMDRALLHANLREPVQTPLNRFKISRGGIVRRLQLAV